MVFLRFEKQIPEAGGAEPEAGRRIHAAESGGAEPEGREMNTHG